MKTLINKIINRNTNIVSNEIDVSLVPEHIRARVEKEEGNENTPMLLEKAKVLLKNAQDNLELMKLELQSPKVQNAIYSLKEIGKALASAPAADKVKIIAEIKESIEAQKNVSLFFPEQKDIAYYKDIKVVQCDDVILSLFGVLPRHPAAAMARQLTGDYLIIVNKAFLDLPWEIQEAIYAHEYGHYALGHLEQSQGVRNFQHELEADAYSASLGLDMARALKALAKENTLLRYQGEYKKRLEALKAL